VNISKIKDDYFLTIEYINDDEKVVFIAAIVDEAIADDLVENKLTWIDIVNELDNIYYLAAFKEETKGHLMLLKKLTVDEIQKNMELIFTNHTLE